MAKKKGNKLKPKLWEAYKNIYRHTWTVVCHFYTEKTQGKGNFMSIVYP